MEAWVSQNYWKGGDVDESAVYRRCDTGLCSSAGAATGGTAPAMRAGSASAYPYDADAVKRGKYLVSAANCAGCHRDEQHGGLPFAGGGANT
jgi:mono/diheme cytochrome c family protein